MVDPMVYLDVHIGVAAWRERWITSRSKRVKGVWDATLQRETLILADGNRLSYFLDGPVMHRDSLPHIFVFHAMFLSGNSFLMTHAPKNYILVCINRPGYFGSDGAGENFSYETFARNVGQLADHLGVEQFCVAGHSSGGPCALACASYMPERVLAVGILSGDPEYAHEDIPDKKWINQCCLGCFLPFFLQRVIPCLPLAQGTRRGLVNDYRLETSVYSFRTESISQPTIVFVGEDDRVLPIHVSRHVHERLNNGQLRVIANTGHLGLLRDDCLDDIFNSILCLVADKLQPQPSEGSANEVSEKSMEIC